MFTASGGWLSGRGARLLVLLLAVVALAASPATGQEQKEGAGRLKTLLKEKRDALRDLVKTFETQVNAGRLAFNAPGFLEATRQLFQTELELADKPEDRVALCETYLKRMRAAEQAATKIFENGRLTAADVTQLKVARIDAEIQLTRERMKQKESKK